MADVGNTIIGTGVNMGIGRGLGALGARIPVPLPNFYNPNSEHHFRDSQAGQLVRGDRAAMRHYGGRVAGTVAGNAIFPVIGGMVGGFLGPHIADLVSGHGWDGRKGPDTSVGGQPALVQDGTSTADGVSIDPFTGERVAGNGSSMPNFRDGTTGSQYGPTINQYAGLPTQPSTDFVMPDFSQYGNTTGGGSGGEGRGDYVSVQPGDNGFGGGNVMGGWNGASSNMMADFAATTNGDWQAQHEGIQRWVRGPDGARSK